MSRESNKMSGAGNEAAVAPRTGTASAHPGSKNHEPENGVCGREASRTKNRPDGEAFWREVEERDEKAAAHLNRARLVEHAAANFAVSYVREAVTAGTLREGDEYVAQVLSFVTEGLRRRGALVGPDGRSAGASVSSTVDLEETRRRALAIACEELRSAIAHCRTQRRETEDSVHDLDGALNDLEITAWVAGAVDRYEDGVGLFCVIGQVNPLTRVVTKLPYRADDGGPSSGGGLLDCTLFRIGGVHLDRAVTDK